jgi:hypothetical protein
MSDLIMELQRENEEEEREKYSFYVMHRELKEGKKIIFQDWLFDWEEDKLDKFIEDGLNDGYIIEIQKLKEGQAPIEYDL